MFPVNGSKGVEKWQFFQGMGCIPYEISRKLAAGSSVAEKKRGCDLLEFLLGTVPATPKVAASFIDRLEEFDGPLPPAVYDAALPGLIHIIDKHDVRLAFLASARLADNFPKGESYVPALTKDGSDLVRTTMDAIFRDMDEWERRQEGPLNDETMNRTRSNLLYFLGHSIGNCKGKELLVGTKDLKRIAALLGECHPGIVNNSLFCIRMAIESDKRVWKGLSGDLPLIILCSYHLDDGIAEEAGKLLALLSSNGLIKEPLKLDLSFE